MKKLSEKAASVKSIHEKIKSFKKNHKYLKRDLPSYNTGNEIGILLIHGFDDTPFIMSEYADYLSKMNYSVYNIILPGRGLKPEDLENTKWEEWVNSAKKDYLLFKKTVKQIFIAGFSTGATISVYLAASLKKNDLPDGLIILSPVIFFKPSILPVELGIFVISILKKLNPYPKKLNNRHLIFIDPKARKKFDTKDRSSFGAIVELLKLIKAVKKIIKNVTTPVLIIQSKKDVVVNPLGAKWIYGETRSSIKMLSMLERSGHPVMADLEKQKVFEESDFFIKTLLSEK